MTDHVQDTAAVREATARLLTALGKLDDAAVREPSLLPGWSRGHVLAHLARNADALVNVLEAARTGTDIPMYAGSEIRDRDIERGAGRPLAVQIEDLTAAADRFNNAAAALHPEAWEATVTLRNGVTDRASRVPFRRLIEIELHHVDLGIGCTVGDLPAAFVERDLEYVAGERFAGRGDVPPLLLTTDDGRCRRTGRTDGDPVAVSGAAAALLGWLTGRADGSDLDAGGAPLPVVPPLG
ncbi:maleylpyruvate isomerase family mycothiol-dependent enzyme [Streptomyces sp. NPDC001922]|uniref:maleylpyruvate isomerase family mycothiol-dependent enzyme n=1 Tax=Streptomyces sp. NPDC001922 TaxID=3364624 RepID=UPI00368EC42F